MKTTLLDTNTTANASNLRPLEADSQESRKRSSESKNSPSPLSKLSHVELAFLVTRVGLGVNLFFHGLVRIPKLPAFVSHMQDTFAGSLLPSFLVTPLAYFIPIAELAIGALLLLGCRTKEALVATSGLMMLLITGCCFAENWGPINSQMFLLVIAAVLIAKLPLNRFSLTKDK